MVYCLRSQNRVAHAECRKKGQVENALDASHPASRLSVSGNLESDNRTVVMCFHSLKTPFTPNSAESQEKGQGRTATIISVERNRTLVCHETSNVTAGPAAIVALTDLRDQG